MYVSTDSQVTPPALRPSDSTRPGDTIGRRTSDVLGSLHGMYGRVANDDLLVAEPVRTLVAPLLARSGTAAGLVDS